MLEVARQVLAKAEQVDAVQIQKVIGIVKSPIARTSHLLLAVHSKKRIRKRVV